MTPEEKKEVCKMCIFSKVKGNSSVKQPEEELTCGVVDKNVNIMIYTGNVCPKGYWKDPEYISPSCGCGK